jgi:hypothetical protein
VSQDKEKGVMLTRLAAEQGHLEAKELTKKLDNVERAEIYADIRRGDMALERELEKERNERREQERRDEEERDRRREQEIEEREGKWYERDHF